MWGKLVIFWLRWRLVFRIAFFVVLAIALFLGIRATPTPAAQSWMSTAYHGVGLFTLILLSFLAFPRWHLWVHGILMFGVGGLIEYAQSYQSTRISDVADMYANAAGVIAGLVLLGLFKWWSKKAVDDQE